MKIFEKREYRGPNDRGTIIGYIKAKDKKEALKILNINNGFIQLYEISIDEFRKKKRKAWKNYIMYRL